MKRKNLIVNISLSGLFCALICAGAFIKIPIPNLPITMQVFFVLLSGLLLTPKAAFFANFSYVFLGLLGIPLFTGGGGLGYVFIPTFGFLIGFIVATPIISFILEKSAKVSFWFMSAVAFLGVLIIYLFGIPYFGFIMNVYKGGDHSVLWIIETALIPYIPKEIISTIAAIFVSYKARPVIRKIK